MEKLQEELESMQPLLAQAAEETVETMEKIKVDSVMKTVHVVEYPPLLSPLLLLPRIRMVDNFLFCEEKVVGIYTMRIIIMTFPRAITILIFPRALREQKTSTMLRQWTLLATIFLN